MHSQQTLYLSLFFSFFLSFFSFFPKKNLLAKRMREEGVGSREMLVGFKMRVEGGVGRVRAYCKFCTSSSIRHPFRILLCMCVCVCECLCICVLCYKKYYGKCNNAKYTNLKSFFVYKNLILFILLNVIISKIPFFIEQSQN